MTLSEVVRKFNATKSGSGYKAHCPAHEDRTESLSISQSGDKILIKCFAGCDTRSVVAAVGLTLRDLFTNSKPQRAPSSITATYTYRDVSGRECYRKLRTSNKDFWFERPDGNGGWIRNAKGLVRHIYRRDELVGKTFVCIVEGEKDANRLWSVGLPATTNDSGAGKWTDFHTAQLPDATDVWILEDNDEPGRRHAQLVAQSCARAGKRVRVITLPGLPEHGDVSDWLDAGYTRDDLVARCEAAPLYASTSTPNSARGEARPVSVATPRTVNEVHSTFRYWLGESYDLDAIGVVIAAAAAERLEGDPPWVLIVSGSGAAKTESVQSLAGVGAVITSTITSEGALLSATPKRETTNDSTGGLLRRLGQRGILVIKDVTTILSMHRDSRTGVLAALREIHDGRWERNVGTNGGRTLTWVGRIVVIGAVTTAWDAAHAVIATMGDRFVLLRLDSSIGRESAGRQAISNTGREVEMRQALSDVVAGALASVDPAQALSLTDAEREQLLAAANVVTLCRTPCEYDYKGEPTSAHAPEMPTRFAKQLAQIMRGAAAVGFPRDDAMRLALRCARDSMPPLRLQILEDLATNVSSRVNDLRSRIDKPWSTVKRQLESLHLLGAVRCDEEQEQVESPDGDSKMKTVWLYSVADDLAVESLAVGPSVSVAEPATQSSQDLSPTHIEEF